MLLFINWLTEQINAVSALDQIAFAPESTDGQETKPIRIMDPEEKKLYVVVAKLSKKLNNLKKEHGKLHADENYDACACGSFCHEAEDLDIKIDTAKNILSESIKMSFEKNEDSPDRLQITTKGVEYWLEEVEECSLKKEIEKLNNLMKIAMEQN